MNPRWKKYKNENGEIYYSNGIYSAWFKPSTQKAGRRLCCPKGCIPCSGLPQYTLPSYIDESGNTIIPNHFEIPPPPPPPPKAPMTGIPPPPPPPPKALMTGLPSPSKPPMKLPFSANMLSGIKLRQTNQPDKPQKQGISLGAITAGLSGLKRSERKASIQNRIKLAQTPNELKVIATEITQNPINNRDINRLIQKTKEMNDNYPNVKQEVKNILSSVKDNPLIEIKIRGLSM